ncbi:hypothetical protein REPUB_Repub08aG0167500 [Reevesia pubescens]
METNYVLLMGLFLLLVSVDCSSSDPKGNVNEKTSLHQNVDGGTVDPVKHKVDSKSVSDGSDTSKSNLNQQSGSNEGENLQKDGKESSVEAKGETDGEKKGDTEHKGQEEESNLEAKGKKDGEKKGDNGQKDQEESNVEAKTKTDGEKKGDNEHKDQEESIVEAKGKTDGEEKGDNEHKGQDESKVEEKGKMDGEKKGDIEHKNEDESKFEDKGKMDGVKKDDNDHKGQEEESNVEAKGKTDGEKKENQDDSVDPKEMKDEKANAQNSILPLPPPPPPTWKDGFHGEECDPSNMCMDTNKRFAACLRVPGNESPELSLLIQNKGKGPLTIKISAPDFVRLEETDVELQEKQDRKVKVSIKNSGAENLIVLKDGSGECSLDFKEFIVYNSAKSYVGYA